METLFTTEEGALLVKLLLSHMIADFLLQTQRSVDEKRKKLLNSAAFWIHIFFVGLLTALFTIGHWNFVIIAVITISHALIDYSKEKLLNSQKLRTRIRNPELYLFLLDQILHLSILYISWLLLIGGLDRTSSIFEELGSYKTLLILLAYVLIVGPVTYLIRFLTIKWADEIPAGKDDSLADAGKWIGMLERIMVMTLVFIDQYTAIGFLITAKSILRLIDKPEDNAAGSTKFSTKFSSRKHTEYVLIGTFLSIGFALCIAILTKWLLTFN